MTSKISTTISRDTTRRSFLKQAGTATVAAAGFGMGSAGGQQSGISARPSTYLDLLRQPDAMFAYSELNHELPLTRTGSEWRRDSVQVEIIEGQGQLSIQVVCPGARLSYLHLRWRGKVAPHLLCLGDAWERSYGDLEWRAIVPDRAMPWYFLTFDGECVHGYGLKTGAGSLGFWQADTGGVSLWLNLCNGGSGVLLGERRLAAATIVTRKGERNEEPTLAATEFCRLMCPSPRPMRGPFYGSNDWYYAYGTNSAELTLRDADLVASLRPSEAVAPFTVVDEGWENRSRFPDMRALAEEIKKRGVRPGIWLRLLLAPDYTDSKVMLTTDRFPNRTGDPAYDPTIPDVQDIIAERLRLAISWGYELIKHDFSTYDMLGRWGFDMGVTPTLPGWSLYDQSRTNAEILLDFYRAIRRIVGERTVVIGCNTVGHLAAGVFELQRIGDDTSGKVWERTRRMGVNTLAYRLPQHRTFFATDPDCVPLTKTIPWEKTNQWLELVARSGMPLFISPEQGAVGPEQKRALARAFEIAALHESMAIPVDWFHTTTPENWKCQRASHSNEDAEEIRFQWTTPNGAYPFQI